MDGLVSRVLAYLPLVEKHARILQRSLPFGLTFDDLVQEGVIGLIDADRRYDQAHDASFGTYAGIRIRGAILDAMRATAWPPKLRRRRRAIETTRAELAATLRHDPADAEIATALGLTTAQMRETTIRGATLQAIAATTPMDHVLLPSCYVPAETRSPLASYEVHEMHERLQTAIRGLNLGDQRVIRAYYGLEELSMAQIAVTMGVSPGRVLQRHNRAVRLLRIALQ